MALTSLITSLRVSTFLTSGQSQVTKLDLSVHGSPETQARLSVAQINVQAQPPTLSRLSDVKINAHVAPPTAERLTRIEVDAWVSLDQAFYALGVFGSNEVMMPDFLVEPIFDTPAAPEVEVNPYRAAEANTDLQQILREQHMTTQAGDSTFHWGVLTEIYNEPLYNLGSLGKFYHDTLGIIHARYCRFVDFNHTDAKAVPVGMRKPLNLPWTVTNQIDLSSADAVIGMAIPYDEKVNIGTWYGWVITEGFVPAEPATATSNLEFGFGTEYGWNASGELKQELDVVSVGYRTAIGGTPRLVPGAFYVNTDRSSLGKANGLITARITPLVDDIGGIKVRLTTLEAGHAAQELALTAINKKHDDFATFMSKEVQNLANAMNAIRALMPDGNFKEYVDTSINNLKGYVDTQLTITNQVANSALAKAQQALSAIDSMSYDAIQVQINALNNAMGGITDRIIGFKTTIDTNTLTAGQVLVSYLYDTDVDGVDYYDFRPVDFKLANLEDVDLVTAPPADGDSLTWDSATQKWVPAAVSGGGGGGGTPWWFDPPTAASFTQAFGGAHGWATLANDADEGLLFDAGAPEADDKTIYAYQAIPSPGSDWTCTMRVSTQFTARNFSSMGMICQNSANSRIIMGALGNGGFAWFVKLFNLNPGGYSSEINHAWNGDPKWLRLAKVGTDIVYYLSAEGKIWVEVARQAIATWLSADPDRIGFGVLHNRSTGPRVVGSIQHWDFQ